MTHVAELIGAIGGGLTIIGLLTRISWSLGQLVQRFGDHVTQADKIHNDQENRIRTLERRPQGGRRL